MTSCAPRYASSPVVARRIVASPQLRRRRAERRTWCNDIPRWVSTLRAAYIAQSRCCVTLDSLLSNFRRSAVGAGTATVQGGSPSGRSAWGCRIDRGSASVRRCLRTSRCACVPTCRRFVRCRSCGRSRKRSRSAASGRISGWCITRCRGPCASDHRSARSRCARPRDEGDRGAIGARGQPGRRAQRPRIRRSLPRAVAVDPEGSAKCASLRAPECAAPRDEGGLGAQEGRAARSRRVGAMVRRVAAGCGRGRGSRRETSGRCVREDVVTEGGLATSRVARSGRIAGLIAATAPTRRRVGRRGRRFPCPGSIPSERLSAPSRVRTTPPPAMRRRRRR